MNHHPVASTDNSSEQRRPAGECGGGPVYRPDVHAMFLGVGVLGWRTMAASLAATPITSEVTFLHREIGPGLEDGSAPTARLKQWVGPVRRWVSPKLLDRRVDAALAGTAPIDHIHCLGHLLARPAAFARRGTGYSVTLDSTELANQREVAPYWPATARYAGRYLVGREPGILAAAEFICTTSRWARDSVVQDYGIPESRVTVNPFPVGPGVPARDDASWVTFVGNEIVRKGGDRLVAWHQAHFPFAELHIVSADPMARAYGDLRNVVVHGPLPNHVVRTEVLPRSRVVVLPTWYDQSPIVLTEAAAAGVPAVASALAGIPELVVSGRTGFAVQPDHDAEFVERIVTLLENDTLWEAMRQGAHAHFHHGIQADRAAARLYALVEAATLRTREPGSLMGRLSAPALA